MTSPIIGDLTDRLEWELSEEESRVGEHALEDLRDEAIHHGRAWTDDTVPAIVRNKILAAAVRYMKNLEGVIQSRAGDETLGYPELMAMGSAGFSTEEIKVIIQVAMGANAGLGSIQIVVNTGGPTALSEYVPTINSGGGPGYPFPFFHWSDPR